MEFVTLLYVMDNLERKKKFNSEGSLLNLVIFMG